MSEQTETPEVEVEDAEVTEESAPKNEEKVTCYLSKRQVPISVTVELKYHDAGTQRVLASLVKF